MKQLYPKKTKLKKGDCIGILSCAGSIDDYSKIVNAQKYFESLGFKVKISSAAQGTSLGYLCASDEERAKAFNDFLADESVDAIIAARGGYGAIRILDKINYEIVKQNPKIFAGYSDITALSLMLFKNTGLITYNAPMAYSDFGSGIDEFSEKSFLDCFVNENAHVKLDFNYTFADEDLQVEGILWGGNLSTIQSLCGLDFIPDKKFVFVAEDVNEPVYKIDKMFTQLFNIEKFRKNAVAIALGDFSGIDNKQLFDKLLLEISQKYEIPVVSGLKFGHEKEKLTFPIGVNCVLDTKAKQIRLM